MKVVWTMASGKLYDAATLNETESAQRTRERYWWEEGGAADPQEASRFCSRLAARWPV
jgi:hypothetical protein